MLRNYSWGIASLGVLAGTFAWWRRQRQRTLRTPLVNPSHLDRLQTTITII